MLLLDITNIKMTETFCIFKWLTIFASDLHLNRFRIRRNYASELIAIFTEYYGKKEEENCSLRVEMPQRKSYTSG